MTMLTAGKDDQAYTFTTSTGDRTSVLAIRATLMASGARFAEPLTILTDAMTTFADLAVPLIRMLLPVALSPALADLARKIVAPAYRGLRDSIITAKRDDAARSTRINETPASLPFADDDRADFRDADLGEQTQWVERADRPMLAALIVAGLARFPGLPTALWDRIVERHAVLAHIEKTGLTADYALKPTPDQPAIVGPDTAAAEAASRNLMTQWHDDQRAVDHAENVLRDTISAVAIPCDVSVADAFALLNGQPA